MRSFSIHQIKSVENRHQFDVRFPPDSDQIADIAGGPFCAAIRRSGVNSESVGFGE